MQIAVSNVSNSYYHDYVTIPETDYNADGIIPRLMVQHAAEFLTKPIVYLGTNL